MEGWMDGMDGGKNEWMDGWTDGRMDGWRNECVDECLIICAKPLVPICYNFDLSVIYLLITTDLLIC
jgi:hypothetical protein